ncbi:MAG: hypothetical protein ACFFCO_10125, partial [Promethearchaeota archaeon]
MVNTKLLAVVLIVAIVGGGAGVYLFFAMPGPIYSTPVSISGLLVTEEYEFGVPFPNSQMQVVLEITDNSGVC